jgi:hypothetical protein
MALMMTMQTFIRCLLRCLLVSCLLMEASAFAAENAAHLQYDPYNPVVLNEFALQKIKERDISTASILLERAALLAPHNVRIQQNLHALRAWQAGKIASPVAVGAHIPTSSAPAASPASAASATAAAPQAQHTGSTPATDSNNSALAFPLWEKK